jgi:phage portal protein BeeE
VVDADGMTTQAARLAEIARAFGIPPHLLGDVDQVGIEQQAIAARADLNDYLNNLYRNDDARDCDGYPL